MNIKDMHVAFMMELDKAMLSGIPSFEPSQIDYFLNKAYLMVINQKLTGNNQLKQGFEESPKRISDLQKLIVHSFLTGQKTDFNALNEFTFMLQGTVNDFLYPVGSVLRMEDPNNSTNKMSFDTVLLSSHESINNLRQSNINKPWIPTPIAVYQNDRMLVYVDPDIVDKLSNNKLEIILTYIKKPIRLNYNSTDGASFEPDIAEHVHQEIVSVAVDLAIENIESPRIQTHPSITNNKE